MARMIVEVMLKPEIHDPQGRPSPAPRHRLGFGQVLGVRQGKRFEVELDGPRRRGGCDRYHKPGAGSAVLTRS